MVSMFLKKVFVAFLTLVLILGNALEGDAQPSASDHIISDGKITWNDFTGQPDHSSNFWAVTCWYVYYTYQIVPSRGNTVTANLQTRTVLKPNSWVLPGKKNDELLQHEQGHFNFAVLTASAFKKAIASCTLLKNNYAQKIDSIFKTTLNKYAQMEVAYDEETAHMLNRTQQALWNKKFKQLLQP